MLNLGVPGGTLEDEAALMYICIHSGLKPSLVLLGVDPFYFNANGKEERTKELQEQYDEYLIEVGQSESNMFGFDWAKWVNLLSFSYFQQGIKKLVENRGNRKNLVVTDKIENELSTIHYDGSSASGVSKFTQVEVNEIANSYTHHQWNNYDEVSLEKAKSLTTLINYIRSHNADVILFMAPYHPITYGRFMNQYEFRQVKNAEMLVEKIVKNENVEVIGNWNPSVCGCDETDFYDAAHMKAKGLDKIFGEYLK